jgi:uncharacterized protein
MSTKEYFTALGIGGAITCIAAAYMTYSGYNKESNYEIPAVLKSRVMGSKICDKISNHLDQILGDSLIKIVRQLQFWYDEGLSEPEMMDLTDRLIETATICHSDFKVPKVRYGKTELEMPVVTCGGMRVQKTWMPDNLPISSKKENVLKHPSQDQLLQLLRLCFKMGITHFETARFYGTSEMQFSDALWTLMKNGEIKREDFILQTKIPPTENRAKWEELFEQSWAHFGERFGYIDLMAFWCVSSKTQIEQTLSDSPDMPMAAALDYQRAGKIKHIGFSTHGPAENILKLIESNKFSFVNLHCHYFGSYHAEGTTDGYGGHGNARAVKRALELDMGVFNISPIDKGGMLYLPSKTLARLLGPKMSPIKFANLTSWKNQKFHTVSVGFGRCSDLEETLDAARQLGNPSCQAELDIIEQRIAAHAMEQLGVEWTKRGLINIPCCEDPATDGTGIGHILWCYNLVKAFGMYDFARARYTKTEEVMWKMKKMPNSNMGRSFDPDVDYFKALENHFNPVVAKEYMAKAHSWLSSKSNMDRKDINSEPAYDLRAWECYPGETPTMKSVLLQHFSFGIFGRTGPTKAATKYSELLRLHISGLE